MLIKEYPNLNRADERVAVDALMGFAYNSNTFSLAAMITRTR